MGVCILVGSDYGVRARDPGPAVDPCPAVDLCPAVDPVPVDPGPADPGPVNRGPPGPGGPGPGGPRHGPRPGLEPQMGSEGGLSRSALVHSQW